jgi:hypothetical protein
MKKLYSTEFFFFYLGRGYHSYDEGYGGYNVMMKGMVHDIGSDSL